MSEPVIVLGKSLTTITESLSVKVPYVGKEVKIYIKSFESGSLAVKLIILETSSSTSTV